MKNKYILKDSLLGGCLGLIITGISIYISRLISEGFTPKLQQQLILYIILFLMFAFWFGVFSAVRHKKNRELNIEEREKILKDSKKYLIIILIITLIGGIISLILKAQLIVTIFIFAASLGLIIWLIGAHIGYLSLKSNIDSINEKLNEINKK